MEKHTPGPWEVYGMVVQSDTGDVCVMGEMARHSGDTARVLENSDANARLIAAAPDLLDALKSARECCLFSDDDGQIGVTEDAHVPADVFNKICAAIAKATGE